MNRTIFNRRQTLEERGISTNFDGSTNNFAQYVHYCRVNLSKSFKFYYVVYLIWSFFIGFFILFVNHYAFGDIICSDGKTNNYMNSGASVLITNIVAYHALIIIET